MRAKTFVTVAALILGLWMDDLIYPAAMIVRESHDDIVVLESTTNGHLYLLDENDGWLVGELAVAVMGTNGTEEVEDDEIIIMGPTGYKVTDLTRCNYD